MTPERRRIAATPFRSWRLDLRQYKNKKLRDTDKHGANYTLSTSGTNHERPVEAIKRM
ncbi:MAG: hypothetical protein AAB573_00850 [Patescibacteria group bacterium]